MLLHFSKKHRGSRSRSIPCCFDNHEWAKTSHFLYKLKTPRVAETAWGIGALKGLVERFIGGPSLKLKASLALKFGRIRKGISSNPTINFQGRLTPKKGLLWKHGSSSFWWYFIGKDGGFFSTRFSRCQPLPGENGVPSPGVFRLPVAGKMHWHP